MKTIDVILCQPKHVDYPWFRFNCPGLMEYVDNVFIALTQSGQQPDISDFFITQALEYEGVRWVKAPASDGRTDWRDIAVADIIRNFALSDYLFFLEQDFLFIPSVLDRVISAIYAGHDLIYYDEGGRTHPAFAIVKRDLVLNTSLNFAADPPHHDHFGKFFSELRPENKVELRDLKLVEREHFYHLAGLTQNYHCYKNGEPFYKPNEFLTYNSQCLELETEHEPSFKRLMEDIKGKYGEGDSEFIKSFFEEEEE